jgi:hypothetical protein
VLVLATIRHLNWKVENLVKSPSGHAEKLSNQRVVMLENMLPAKGFSAWPALLLYENGYLLNSKYLLSSLAWLLKQPANLSQPKNLMSRKCLLPKHTCYMCINQSENDYEREKKFYSWVVRSIRLFLPIQQSVFHHNPAPCQN